MNNVKALENQLEDAIEIGNAAGASASAAATRVGRAVQECTSF